MTNPQAFSAFISATTGRAAQLRAVPQPATAASGAPAAAQSDEADLLSAVAYRGDEAAFERLYHAHVRAVIAAARQICRSDAVAEEIAQRTFLTLWERAPRLVTRPVRLRSWLLTVARNAAIDHVRTESPHVALDAAAGVAARDEGPQDAAVTNALYAELAPALATLSSDQRLVIELRFFSGYTFAAIAAFTGEPLGTVKSRARLAIEHLRSRFAE